jgi:membrane protease YdiL (CAAX protease family)
MGPGQGGRQGLPLKTLGTLALPFRLGRMRPLSALALYLGGVIVGGALLAPWVHGMVHALAADSGFFHQLSQQPFSRYLTRCFLVLALVGIWPLARAFHIRHWHDLGWTSPRGQGKNLAWGLIAGFASLAVALGLGLALGGRSWDAERTTAQIARHLFNALSAAVVVSVLEETLFRGAIYGALRRAYGWRTALMASSALFALVHFFGRVQWKEAVAWDSGLRALPQLFAGFLDLQQLLPGFINLALAGAILAWLYERSGSLYASVGLHAGWIFWLKTGGFFTRIPPDSSTWVWGSAKLLDGWVTVPVLILVGLWSVRLPERVWTGGMAISKNNED